MNLEFKRPTLEDRPVVDQYFRASNSRSCEDNFANFYLWNRVYPTGFAIVDDMMVLKSEREDQCFRFPKGDQKHLKSVLEKMMDYAKQQGVPFKLCLITPEQFEVLEELYPGKFQIAYDRDAADYVYEQEKLAKLSGKKYHGKKNHVNKFRKTYENWRYETITDENVEDCFQMALAWRRQNGCEEIDEKRTEMCVTLNALRLMKELKLTGGCLWVEGQVIAFSIGEAQSEDTFVVHIEKALTEYEGAYPMINQQFVQHEMEQFLYVNREEDTGDEGLRKAKLSYRPVFLVEKGIVTMKEEEM